MSSLCWSVVVFQSIHWAAIKRHSAIVELLLQYEANPNARNTAGWSVLQACMKKIGIPSNYCCSMVQMLTLDVIVVYDNPPLF